MYIAHSGSVACPDGQPIQEHLAAVAQYASDCFAHAGMRELARLIGWYHDAGKYKDEVQRHILLNTTEKIDHATLGAQLIASRLPHPRLLPLVALPILGHHGGIPDGAGSDGEGRSMELRLRDSVHTQAQQRFVQEIVPQLANGDAKLTVPVASAKTMAVEAYMAIRMLHSALVDGDYLDTERFFDPQQAQQRGHRPALLQLVRQYNDHMTLLEQQARVQGTAAGMVELRGQIQRWCLAAAQKEQGFFSLSVPTGGGKTLASLGFALRHAERNTGIKRIVYAIPFTSIVEQTVQIFRQVLGPEAVLEHHSAATRPEEGTLLDRASENWDAPVVITTNVQLFESIFSNKPSKSRKLHNLQDSVIILDELQALPDDVLKPCLAALDVLVKDYRATVVLCTATLPDYNSAWLEKPAITEIVPEPLALFEAMRRTKAILLGTLEDAALQERLAERPQVLCIVNSRPYAQQLAQALGGEAAGVYHLSTMMCPAHRTQKLNHIRGLLAHGEQCRLISTSLIEAGVDIDFPVVYRELAGLDSIAQSAGRCNRNGRAAEPAPVYIFETTGKAIPPQVKRLAGMTLKEVAPTHCELLSPAAMQQYFALRFGAAAQLDKQKILSDILDHAGDLLFPFSGIDTRFCMIESVGETIYIPYDSTAKMLLQQLGQPGYSLKNTLRSLQPYAVTVYEKQKQELQQRGYLGRKDDFWLLDVPEAQLEQLYSDCYGLMVQAQMTLLLCT